MAREITPVQLHTSQGLPSDVQAIFGPIMEGWNDKILQGRKSEEQLFAELDVQPGDRVRLTELEPRARYGEHRRRPKEDGATLEGVVLRVKRGKKDGRWKLQVNGFAIAGNAIFWPVSDYRVEVLHRAYRWTATDHVVAELAGFSESAWVKLHESERGNYRLRYAARVDKIISTLGGKS